MILDLCGWIGSILLAVCGVPEAIKAFKEKNTGLTWGLLLMWFIGELFAIVYVIGLGSWPLLCNYGVNITILLPVLWYKAFPGRRKAVVEKIEIVELDEEGQKLANELSAAIRRRN